jgi:hypothetical protein
VTATRERHGYDWRKRIAEDPVEVLAELGARPGTTVDVVLRDLTTARRTELRGLPMTEENRRRVKESWEEQSRQPLR